ncbi:MAG: serpin family protein [Prevotellaceae bacterium]|jgi:serpin B|nr:serpin family protein [Prevotellaceae bacterium]
MKLQFISFAATFIVLASCSRSGNDTPDVLPDAEPIKLRSALVPKIETDNSFAFDLFKRLYSPEELSNTFVSPLSVSMALSMTLNGAAGETRREMESALKVDGFTAAEINEYCKTLREALLQVDPSTRFSIANSIWTRRGFAVEQTFKNLNRESFAAEIKEADFDNPATLTQINKWCADNTGNKIPAILEAINPDAVMYLINAVYFKAIWKSKFDKQRTLDGVFKGEDGGNQNVKMMRQMQQFGYNSDETAAWITMPYGNGAFSMTVILPHEGKTLNQLVDGLDNQSFKIDDAGLAEVNLQLPRFKTECEYRLEDVLPEMGMRLAFTDKADFSGINQNAEIFISKVIHKTFASIDEEGSEAAAVTAVEMGLTSAGPNDSQPVDFIVNKPFIFMIRENSTGVILFMGAMKKIAE